MKRLHITNAWSETSGGVATFYRALIEAADRRRESMVLVVPGAENTHRQLSDWVSIYEVQAPKARLNPAYRTIYPIQFFVRGGRVREILKAEEPDLVEINDKYALNYLGPLLRLRLIPEINFRPVVVGLSCERMDLNFQTYIRSSAVAHAFCKWYMRYAYFAFVDHHIAVSEETAAELRSASEGHEISRAVFQLPMGVDCRLFSPKLRTAEARRKWLSKVDAPHDGLLLLYAGRLVPEKNLGLLLDTVEQLKTSGGEVHLLIAGDGISREGLLQEAEHRVPGRVHWLGHIRDRNELAQLFACCDVFVHPNPREPFGIAPLEAMASGLALVAPNSGGVTVFANHENALLCNPSGPDFASAISELLQDEARRQAITSAAVETAGQYAWEAVTDRFSELYRGLYEVSRGHMNIEQLAPAFISQPASASRKASMKIAAKVAAGLYSAWARLQPSRRSVTTDQIPLRQRSDVADSVKA